MSAGYPPASAPEPPDDVGVVDEEIERVRIGDRTRWPRPPPAGGPERSRLTGTSIFLPVSVRGTAGTATISSGTWRCESAVRIAPLIRARVASSSSTPVGEDDEQRHPVAAVRQLEPDDEAVDDLGQALDDAVQLARPEPDAARLRVESERPSMTALPRSVIRIQSPWRQTPGYISK